MAVEWFRRQPSARGGSCMEDVRPASHWLLVWVCLNTGDKFRVGGVFEVFSYVFSDVVSFPQFIVNYYLYV